MATPNDTHGRLLVLANAAVAEEPLVEEIVSRANGSEVVIVSPARVPSRLDLAAGDVDDEIEEARRRLQASVDALRHRGINATGEVGEAEPELALRDGLVKFPADEVIILAQPEGKATWLEKDLLERASRESNVPITYVEVS